MKRILIVDDASDILEMLGDVLEAEGYAVQKALSGEEAIAYAETHPDLILLDVTMPEPDGLSVCRTIRSFVDCPILFLTARISEQDKIRGFQAGGDDYILKPFSIDELLARVDAHLRRDERHQTAARIHFTGGLTIDYTARAVYYRDKALSLTRKEFDIIELLSLYAGQVFDKERIYDRIWGLDSEGDSSVIAEHIRRIRAKLGSAGLDNPIDTVWGVGYKWKK